MTEDTKGAGGSGAVSRSRREFLRRCGLVAGGLGAGLAAAGAARAAASGALAPGEGLDEPSWREVRRQFALSPRIVHLNTGTEGSMPRVVLDRHARYNAEFAANPMQAAMLDPDYDFLQENNRARAAAFLGAAPEQVAVTTNTTEGVSWVLHGFPFAAGDEVVTTLHEHGAGLSPLQVLRDRRGVVIRWLPLRSPPASSDEIVAGFLALTTPRTRVWSLCHVNYTTGLRMPVAELCALARERGIVTVVDGAHAAGMLDFRVDALGCDFYATSGHKWLCGPPGTGMLYVRDGLANPHGLFPVGTEIYGFGYPLLACFQVRGQQSGPSLRALADAMEFQEALGRARIERRVLGLNAYLKERLVDAFGTASLLTPRGDGALSSGLASFLPFPAAADRFDAVRYEALVGALIQGFGIYVRSVQFVDQPGDPGPTSVLRVSTHLYNSRAELDAAVEAVARVVAGDTPPPPRPPRRDRLGLGT